jgi:hypothetical protein
VLPSSVCESCGLDLGVPLSTELLAVSALLVDTERRRRGLIERIWTEQLDAQARAYARARSATPPMPEVVPDAAVAAAASANPVPVTAPPVPPSATTPPAAAPAPRRRSGVQVFLLVAGIVLLSVFALFFLTVAYLFATVEVRVVVTALAGVGVFGVAWVLARRRLPATAEGIGVAGAAILLGTLGFVRGAELFGSAALSPALFLGLGLLVLAALLSLVHRITSLRFARIGSLLLFPTGVALIVIGAVNPIDAGLAWWSGLSAAGSSTLLLKHREDRTIEAALVRSIALGSTATALVPAAFVLPDLPGSSAVAYLISALAWAAFIRRLSRHSSTTAWSTTAWSTTASALLGLSLALAPAVAILRDASTGWNLWLPGAAAGAVAAALVILARVSSTGAATRTLAWARWPALVVAAVGLIPGAGIALVHVLGSLIPRYSLWQANVDAPTEVIFPVGAWAAVLAPGLAALLGVVVIRLVRLPEWARAVVGSLAGLALLAAASQGGTLIVALPAYLLVAVAGLTVLLNTRRRRAPAAQAPAAVALGAATLALVVLAHASGGLWLPTVLSAVCLIAATRYALASDGAGQRAARTALTAIAVALLFAEATLVVPWVSGLRSGSFSVSSFWSNPFDFVAIPGAAAAVLLGVTALAAHNRVDRAARGAADLRAAAVIALPVVIASSLVAAATPASSTIDHVTRIAMPLLLAIAGVLWQARRAVSRFSERVVLACVAPVAISAAFAALADAIAPTSELLGSFLAGPVAAILTAAIGVLTFARASSRLHGVARVAWQSSTTVAVIAGAVLAILQVEESSWIMLVLLAVAPLIIASSSGNPFTATAPRRYFIALSCILAVAGLWQFLVFRGISDVEPYSLPVAGLLLGLTTAVAVFGTRSAAPAAGRSMLLAAGLVVALGPSSIPAIVGAPERGVVLLGMAAVLAAAALVAPQVVRGILVRETALVVAMAVLVVVGGAGVLRDAVENTAPIPELWILPAALVLVATSIVWTRRRALPFWVARFGVPAAVALVALGTVVCLVALPGGGGDTPRLVGASAALCAVAIVAAVRNRVPVDAASWLSSVSALVVVGITGLATSAAEPFELATAPLALTLIVSGVVALHRERAARSWPHLGPGVAVLLVPPLLADFGSTELWRVIALGVLSVIVVVAAIALRWQAPLLVGATVLIVHALAQSWPWIQGLYSAVPWWIWLGVGGIVLIAVAARYEHRVRNLRSFVGSIAALR